VKVLGIMGSPRIRGNTDLLLDEALRGARSQGVEVEKLVVDKLMPGILCLPEGRQLRHQGRHG